MTQFKAIFQVTKRKYDSIAKAGDGVLYLVRDGQYDGEGADARLIEDAVSSYSVYFGTRKYSDDGQFFYKNLNTASGGLFDVNGQFIFPAGVEWTSITTDGIDSLADLLKALDTVIKANTDKFASYYDKDSVDGLLKAFAKSVDVKVNDTTTISGSVDEEGKISIDLSSAFDAAGKVKDVKVGGTTVVGEDGVANITIPEVPFQSVVTDDKVLTLNGGVLSSTLSYTREDVEGVDSLVLKGIDGAVIGSVSVADFIADGMLESVTPVEGTNKFKFTFKKVDGSTEDFEVDFGQFVDTYHADGTSIELDSTNNTFSVKEVESEKVSVDQIPVGGTPLAQILLDNNINSINSGNLQEVLEALFSQNNWAENPRRNIPTSLSVSMSNPDLSFDKSGTVEVGTTVNVTATAKTATASASITYDGFDYGYSLENDNTKDGDKPSSVSISGTKDADSNYKLSFVTNNGFGNKDIDDVNGTTLTATPMVVADGANKITVTASSPTFTATVPAQGKIYACSSLNKTDEEHVVDASEESTISGSVKTSTNNKSITGAYYAFVGFSDTLPKTNDEYRAFIGNNYSRLGKGSVTSGTCNKTYMAVCIPSNWDFTCNTSLGADMRGSFTETGDVTITLPDNTTKAYKYYALTYKDGAFKDLVIK